MTELSVVLGDYPHTRPLKAGQIPVEGVSCRFIDAAPLYSAFGRMVRDLAFDVCEMAIATYLQARQAGVPVTLLPLVMIGDVHHRSLNRWPGSESIGPEALMGRRVGVRAYTQTTGLWVRGILREEFGVDADRITWVTVEGAHVAGYVEPPYVERVGRPLAELLRGGAVAAAVIGPRTMASDGIALQPVISDPEVAGQEWIARHRTVPVNHMIVARSELVASDPDALGRVYRAIRAGIDETADQRDDTPRGRAVGAGWTDELLRALELASRYAVEQELVRERVDVDALQREIAPLEL